MGCPDRDVRTVTLAVSQQENAPMQMVCLANSRKLNGRCIAGKELEAGNAVRSWIRPVSKRENQAVSEYEPNMKTVVTHGFSTKWKFLCLGRSLSAFRPRTGCLIQTATGGRSVSIRHWIYLHWQIGWSRFGWLAGAPFMGSMTKSQLRRAERWPVHFG